MDLKDFTRAIAVAVYINKHGSVCVKKITNPHPHFIEEMRLTLLRHVEEHGGRVIKWKFALKFRGGRIKLLPVHI